MFVYKRTLFRFQAIMIYNLSPQNSTTRLNSSHTRLSASRNNKGQADWIFIWATASQTQLKRGFLEKHPDSDLVDRTILDWSDELLSPSGYDSVDEEDFVMNNSDSSDTVGSSCC